MKKTLIKEVRKATCVHHWLIDAKDHGLCIKCGEGRQFFPPHNPEDYSASTCWAIQKRRKRANDLRDTG